MSAFDPIPFRGAYIGGRFRSAARGERFRAEDPGDLDRPVGAWRADPAWTDAAVDAARRAAPAWRRAPLAGRVAALRRYRSLLKEKGASLAFLISRETGKSRTEARGEVAAMADKVDVTVALALPLVAGGARDVPGAREVQSARPLGVVGVIGPFNVPGHLPNGQIVPALLMGNAVVFKPSELTPFTAQAMAELWDAAGLPPGVFNLVPGAGAAGAALAAHPGVDGLFFTGSVPTGRRIAQAAAAQPSKLLALEMGGKNAALVLADADVPLAVREVIHGAFATAGQRCSCTSRVFVHARAAADFLNAFLPAVDAVTAGYFTEDPVMGPLVTDGAATRFLGAEAAARRLGFRTLRAGRRLALARRGRYVSPSVRLLEGYPRFAGGADRSYWDEELFAPDVAVYILKDEDEMTALHNASMFGLAASVFTRRRAAFDALRRDLEAGVVHWNRTTAMTPGTLPFGGVKASGNHRPAGLHAILSCADPVASVERPA